MCIYMYIYVYMCIYNVRVYTCIYVYIRVYMCIYVYIRIYTYIYMYISWLYDCQLLSVEMSETKFLQVIFHCGVIGKV